MLLLFSGIGFAQTPIYEFNFDGNLTDNLNSATLFTSTPTVPTYSVDRFGVSNKALSSNSTSANVNLANLPVGNAARSVSFWVKFNNISFTNHDIFGYGTLSDNQAFAFQQISEYSTGVSSVKIFGWGSNTYNVVHDIPTNANVWYHYVITSDVTTPGVGGATTKIYRDNVLIKQQTNVGRNTVGTTFYVGKSTGGSGSSNASIDDLKIYNYALSQAQVNALSNQDFNSNNLKFSLYPNPATNLVNIDLATELKSVEIYSLQGQKVLTSNKNQVDVFSLSKGMYMVRVKDVENGVSTQKLVVK